jgi:asparagine synthase (glutamine-hydrolysing)
MCGIVAVYAPRGTVSSAALESATRALHHRGPDGRRHWISRDRHVALGHTRLAIIDLSTGDQPIANEDERLQLVANGEFYGYEAIQRRLEAGGHRLRTRSDSEIALHLYEDVGPQCLHQLRGEFAFVIWDDANQRLFAARDRFGIKPLFYTWHGDTLYLASEVKALFAAGVPACWDEEYVYHSLGASGSQQRTLYRGVFQVPPGYFLIATESHLQLHQYWDFDFPPAADTRMVRADAEYAESFRAVLDEAVRLRLRADVPVGCYLSGGLDSCSVLGLAARHHPEPIRAFTLTFDRADYDEGEVAREMAARAGAQFEPIPIRQDDLADHFSDAIHQAETFCMNAHGVGKYLLSRAVRKAGYKVVFTGEGSDEILGGYAHFRRDMLLYNQEGQDAAAMAAMLADIERMNPVSRGLMMAHGDFDSLEHIRRRLGYVPSWMEAFSSRARKMADLLAAPFLERYGESAAYVPLLDEIDVRGQLAGRDPLNQSLHLWGKTSLPSYVLTMLGDRMEMAHSIEGRVPFLDHHVVEALRSMPVAMKNRGMTEKYVLREAARDVISDTVYRRQKHPFLSPPATLNPSARLYALAQDTLRGPVLASVPFFDERKVVALLDRLHALDEGSIVAYDPCLMHVLSICVLHERFRMSAE